MQKVATTRSLGAEIVSDCGRIKAEIMLNLWKLSAWIKKITTFWMMTLGPLYPWVCCSCVPQWTDPGPEQTSWNGPEKGICNNPRKKLWKLWVSTRNSSAGKIGHQKNLTLLYFCIQIHQVSPAPPHVPPQPQLPWEHEAQKEVQGTPV